MKVSVIFRGGCGDLWLWLGLAQSLRQFHVDDHITFHVVSTWPEAAEFWVSRLDPPVFDKIKTYEYSRPASNRTLEAATLGAALVYHWDVWLGSRGVKDVQDVSFTAAHDRYPWLTYDPHPKLSIPGDKIGGTVIQPAGVSVEEPLHPEWWRTGAKNLPKPIRVLGRDGGEPEIYGASDRVETPEAIYSACKSAELAVVVDSGFRNVALACGRRVIEVRKLGRGYPSEVFTPPVYRDQISYLDLDPPPLDPGLARQA